jgi:mannose-6-phosphate isomerase-like protein (cupin superfamily)
MDWSDVGSWDAVWKLAAKDANNNVTRGEIVALDTRSSLLRSEKGGPLVAALGLNQIAVIATDDAVFVSPLNRVSEVKQIVERLKEEGRDCAISPSKTGQTIAGQPRFQVERVIINPGDCLAQENPASGSAHWIVVRGEAQVMIGDQVSMLYENHTTFIPAGTKHRLANISDDRLELLEIRCGSDPGENDIEQIEN